MSTNFDLLGKGLKYLGVLIFLFIASPIALTIGFKALKKFENTSNEYLSYIVLLAAGIFNNFYDLLRFQNF